MFRPRVIPCLLLKNSGLVKSIQFKNHRYIGDPINAVKLFNDHKADELVFLDITATNEKKHIPLDLVQKLGEECNMPFTVGGGIQSIEEIKAILSAGAEKVCINTQAIKNPDFIRQAADTFGSSTIVVSIDVKKNMWGKYEIYSNSGTKKTGLEPLAFALNMEKMGAGEILINSIDLDGTMSGYDLNIIYKICKNLSVPVIACGGAGKLADLRDANKIGKASAVAAGSLFVYHGPRKAVLISFPSRQELIELFK
ncbi:MAG TPA: AglZ/HisF2 family acetamidino modification protein [bacterium]|nr:AglZ/HisF2 family acetamidino modification protein [bacterium]HPN42143.1 AglZ/HisF2 family acetamidino modification protein [bacterium]